MNIAIIYHDADFDGKLSHEACYFWLSKYNHEAYIDSYGWDYGREVPTPRVAWEDYEFIYIVDLSVDALMARQELAHKIVWIDHHRSAIAKWDEPFHASERFYGFRLDGVAACRLCWNYMCRLGERDNSADNHPSKEDFVERRVSEPSLIRLAGEYDVWDHRDPDGKALQFGLRAISKEELAHLVKTQFTYGLGGGLTSVVKHGQAIKAYCDKNNDSYSKDNAHTLVFEGVTFCALNVGQRGNSDLLRGGILPEHQALFAWRFDGKTRQATISLYHAPGHEDIDLSVIAKKYGGGGHKGACGFRMPLSELAKIL